MSNGGPCTFICSRTVRKFLHEICSYSRFSSTSQYQFDKGPLNFWTYMEMHWCRRKLRHIYWKHRALPYWCIVWIGQNRAKSKFLQICWHNRLICPFSNIAIVINLRALFQHEILPQISMLLDSGIISFGIIMRVDMIGMYLRSCKTRWYYFLNVEALTNVLNG